jgi:H/ACA ribonucleoprotein complex subunit 2
VVVIAADISPMDVISHIPVLCEDHNIPYIYVTSRAELGLASKSKRATSVIMLTRTARQKEGESEDEGWAETYAELVKLVRKASVGVLR